MEILLPILIFISILWGIIFLSRPSFLERKSRLMNMYSSLMSDMNLDYRNMEIGIENIRNLSRSILNFSGEVEKISEQVKWEDEIDQKWLTDIINEFSQNLKLWMSRHMSELNVTEMNIGKAPEWNTPALTLARKRLDVQIQNLQRVKALI